MTQPLDTLKTVLQSGLFGRFRALADSKVFTLPVPNVITAFRAYFGSYVDIGKLYNGATLRFMELSFYSRWCRVYFLEVFLITLIHI